MHRFHPPLAFRIISQVLRRAHEFSRASAVIGRNILAWDSPTGFALDQKPEFRFLANISRR
jgi:hypothetical protein